MSWSQPRGLGASPVPRFSHSMTLFGLDERFLLILGGVTSCPSEYKPAVLDVSTWNWLPFPSSDSYSSAHPSSLWLCHHSCVVAPSPEGPALYVVGGGGCCFGFGAYFSPPVTLPVKAAEQAVLAVAGVPRLPPPPVLPPVPSPVPSPALSLVLPPPPLDGGAVVLVPKLAAKQVKCALETVPDWLDSTRKLVSGPEGMVIVPLTAYAATCISSKASIPPTIQPVLHLLQDVTCAPTASLLSSEQHVCCYLIVLCVSQVTLLAAQ